MTKDHFYPKSQGGITCVWCCYNCQRIKNNKTPIQWLKWIKNSKLVNKERMYNATITFAKKMRICNLK